MTSYPTFTWAAAYPLDIRANASYELKIVEIIGDQTPEAAIQANPDWYFQKGIRNLLLTYPLSAPSFSKGKRYAWQVRVEFLEGKSETYTPRTLDSEVYWFGLSEQVVEECLPVLSQRPDKSYFIVKAYQLKFTYPAEASVNPGAMQYRILNSSGLPIHSQPIKPSGATDESYYSFPLKTWEVFRKKATRTQFYTLEATSPQGEVYQLKFTCE